MVHGKRILAALCVVALVGGYSNAQERRAVPEFQVFGESPGTDTEKQIDTVIEQYKHNWAEQDAKALIELHAEDVEWINAYARMFRGSAALQAFLEQRLFPAFDQKVSRQEADNMRTISIRYLGNDAAVVHMYTDGSRGPSRNAGERMRRTHLHLVIAWQSGGWKVVHTAIMDAR